MQTIIIFSAIIVLITGSFSFILYKSNMKRNFYEAIARNKYEKLLPFFLKIKEDKIFDCYSNLHMLKKSILYAFEEKCTSLENIGEIDYFMRKDKPALLLIESNIYFQSPQEILNKVIVSKPATYFVKDYVDSVKLVGSMSNARKRLLVAFNEEASSGKKQNDVVEKLNQFITTANLLINERLGEVDINRTDITRELKSMILEPGTNTFVKSAECKN